MDDINRRFENLNLVPGHSLQIAIDGYGNERGKSLLVGYLPKHSIVVTAPMIAGVPNLLGLETQLTVRMFVPRIGSVCAFRSKVIHVGRQPYPHLHLAMPKDIVVGEVRRSVRAEVSLPGVAYFGQDFAQQHSVTLNDLSVGGSLLEVTEPLVPIGEPIRLVTHITVENVERELSIEARVRAADYHSSKKTVSVQFTQLDDNDRIALYAFVMQKLYQ